MLQFCVGTSRSADLYSKDTLAQLRAAGVTELSVHDGFLMGGGVSRADVARLRGLLDEAGIRAATSHPPFGSWNDGFSTLHQTKGALAEELDWMREFLARCGVLGIRAIPLHTGGAMLPASKEWEIEIARAYVRALLPAAEAAGVVIAVENTNHADPVGWGPGVQEKVEIDRNRWEYDDTEKVVAFVESFHSPFVRVCYDTGHSHLLGKVMEDFYAFAPYTALFHIHDNDGAWSDSHLQPGYGNTPWSALLGEIERRGMDAPLFIEARPQYGDTALMLRELAAIAEGRVDVLPGGFLRKDPATGRIVIREGAK